MHDLSTTLVAVATPPGRGGIGCVRLSGSDAVTIAHRLFRPQSEQGTARPGGRPCFGHFVGRNGHDLDHGYLVVFAPGASYTGELTAEAWAHGSPTVLSELVAGAVEAGAAPAGPGEFTYRAVRNGRLDLTRAEAIEDLIAARTVFQARVALTQAEGSVARELEPLRERLEEWIARGEAAVEFVEESDTHLPSGDLTQAIEETQRECRRLLQGYVTGRWVRDGAQLALVGRPNAGKSSLFNRLLARDRAIVTATPGTTRDTLEEGFELDGIPVRLTDTAGLRDVDDVVEQEGVRRAERARADADLVVWVVDGSDPHAQAELAAAELAQSENPERTVIVVNKSDLDFQLQPLPSRTLVISALTGQGIDRLREALRERLVGGVVPQHPLITNQRHAQALQETQAALDRASAAGAQGMSEELVLEDLREAMAHLGTITGEFTQEDMYDRIFSSFCIGK